MRHNRRSIEYYLKKFEELDKLERIAPILVVHPAQDQSCRASGNDSCVKAADEFIDGVLLRVMRNPQAAKKMLRVDYDVTIWTGGYY